MTTDSPTISPTASGHVTIVFTSDWGVSTGVGQAGRTHSTIERCGNDPVVRGTVITGVLREQAMLAAKALDGQEEGKWTSFALWLFGQDPNSEPDSTPHPRHVLFSDLTPASTIPVHDTVSLSINPKTGTARDQFLRFTERAAAGVLTGTFTLIDEAGAEISDKPTIQAAYFLLGVAGLMVRGIGSGRSGGDGECTVVVSNKDYVKTDLQNEEASKALARILENQGKDSDSVTYSSADVETVADQLRRLTRENLQTIPGPTESLAKNNSHDIEIPGHRQGGTQHQVGAVNGSAAQHSGGHHLILDLTLDSPIVSYEVPFSNEIRSLDFLRGTVLLPWLHRLVSSKRHGDKEAVVTNAVTGGHLFVSDALPVISDAEGHPVPLTLKTDKTLPSDSLITLYGDSQENKGKIPVHDGYVFFAPKGGDGEGTNTAPRGWYGKPPLRGRQTTAINHETGAASKGQLVLVEALPEKMRMRAHVWVSDELCEAASVSDLLDTTREARLGSRKLTGTFGSARCTLREETAAERESRSRFGNAGIAQPTGDASTSASGTTPSEGTTASSDYQTVSLWFTSDMIARSDLLGPGGTADDLIRAFKCEGITVKAGGTPYIRHRRVDSWSPADNGPRATRLAIQAGSVIQVSVNDENHAKLLELAPFGVGELTAQGYGRFIVDHPLLSVQSIDVTKAKLEHFVCEETPKGGEDK
nr:CRISPR-associated protein [uncultured Actinomyces sp.]